MIHFLRTLFRPSPVIVNTYKTRRTDLQQKRVDMHLKLSAELGKPYPLRLRYNDAAALALDIEAFGEDDRG